MVLLKNTNSSGFLSAFEPFSIILHPHVLRQSPQVEMFNTRKGEATFENLKGNSERKSNRNEEK